MQMNKKMMQISLLKELGINWIAFMKKWVLFIFIKNSINKLTNRAFKR